MVTVIEIIYIIVINIILIPGKLIKLLSLIRDIYIENISDVINITCSLIILFISCLGVPCINYFICSSSWCCYLFNLFVCYGRGSR